MQLLPMYIEWLSELDGELKQYPNLDDDFFRGSCAADLLHCDANLTRRGKGLDWRMIKIGYLIGRTDKAILQMRDSPYRILSLRDGECSQVLLAQPERTRIEHYVSFRAISNLPLCTRCTYRRLALVIFEDSTLNAGLHYARQLDVFSGLIHGLLLSPR